MGSTKPQTGDILLYRKNSFLSKAIQWFEKCPWSHASLVFDVYGEILVSEAEAKGLIANDIPTSIKDCEILILRPKFEVNPVILSKFIAPNLGKHRYGFIRLTIVQIVWQLFHKWILNESKYDKLRRVICGMWVAYVYYNLSGEKYFLRWYRDTPASIFESDLFEHYTLEV
jgi:hypothetical protein